MIVRWAFLVNNVNMVVRKLYGEIIVNKNVIVRNTAIAKKVLVNVFVNPGFTEGIAIYHVRSNCTAQLVQKNVIVVTEEELKVVII